MPNATIRGGDLIFLDAKSFYVFIPNYGPIFFNNLPDISDSKSAAYNDEPIIGRAFPLKTFSHSENRVISLQLHFFVLKQEDIRTNLNNLRALASCTYPRDASQSATVSYAPPIVCRLKFGELLGSGPICAVLKSYSVKFPTDVAWDTNTFVPYKFDVDTNWEAIYKSSNL